MTTEARYYNTDPRYEMMLAILPDPQFENLPDAKEIVADLKEIVRLCHHYTIDDDTPNQREAWELAHAIIDYLLTEWGTHRTEDLATAAKEYWRPGASAAMDTPEDGTAKGVHTVDTPEEKGLTTADTPQGMQNAHTPDDGLLIP